jgi:hypothetical protein
MRIVTIDHLKNMRQAEGLPAAGTTDTADTGHSVYGDFLEAPIRAITAMNIVWEFE